MLDKIKTLLRSDEFKRDTAIFPDVDPPRLRADLRLEERGKERGQANTPPASAEALDLVENEIIERVGALRKRGIEKFEEHRQVYSKRLNGTKSFSVAVETGTRVTLSTFQKKVREGLDATVGMQERIADHYKYRDDFRKKNKLTRPAGKELDLLSLVLIGLLAVVLEAALNAWLFAQANPFGLMGGLMTALLVSLINVGLCTLLGIWSLHVNSVGILKKLLGTFCFLFWLCFAGVYNLLVAHFRDAVETQGLTWQEAGHRALVEFTTNPSGLDTFESILLMLFGTMISIMAYIKGLYSQDPVPGYARIEAELDDARSEYQQHNEDKLAELEQGRDDAVRELTEVQDQIRNGMNDAVDVLFGHSALETNLQQFLAQCDQCANFLLSAYRDVNSAARSEAVPAHFQVSFAFPAFVPGEIASIQKDAVARDVDEINAKIGEAIQQIFDTYAKAIHDHPSIDDIQGTHSRLGTKSRLSEDAGGVDIEPMKIAS